MSYDLGVPVETLKISHEDTDALLALLEKVFGQDLRNVDVSLRRHGSMSPARLYVTVTKRKQKAEEKTVEFWSEEE